MNKNYLIYDKITLNQSYESLLTMTVSHIHIPMYIFAHFHLPISFLLSPVTL